MESQSKIDFKKATFNFNINIELVKRVKKNWLFLEKGDKKSAIKLFQYFNN